MTKKQTEEQKHLHTEIIKQMLTLATSGFGLVAALAWNNVIQEFFKVYGYHKEEAYFLCSSMQSL